MSLPTRLRSADFPYNPDHRFEKRTCNSICHSPDQEKQKRLPVKQYSLSHIQPGYYRTRELFQERTVLLQILLPVYSSDSQWLSIVLRFCSKTEISLSEGHSSFSITASESVDLHNTARAGGRMKRLLHTASPPCEENQQEQRTIQWKTASLFGQLQRCIQYGTANPMFSRHQVINPSIQNPLNIKCGAFIRPRIRRHFLSGYPLHQPVEIV